MAAVAGYTWFAALIRGYCWQPECRAQMSNGKAAKSLFAPCEEQAFSPVRHRRMRSRGGAVACTCADHPASAIRASAPREQAWSHHPRVASPTTSTKPLTLTPQHVMSTHPPVHSWRLYPAYCFRESPTYDAWVKLTVADVHALRSEPAFLGTPPNMSMWPRA
jgi:hypothetical protein